VQFLYLIDLNGEKAPGSVEIFWKLRNGAGKAPAPKRARDFAEQLVTGVMTHLEEVDERIKKYTTNYEMERLAVVDRNILRMAIFEMLHSPEVAPIIIINEAIEVAKKFGAEKSGSFINGVLDKLKEEAGRPARGEGAAAKAAAAKAAARKAAAAKP